MAIYMSAVLEALHKVVGNENLSEQEGAEALEQILRGDADAVFVAARSGTRSEQFSGNQGIQASRKRNRRTHSQLLIQPLWVAD
jgi:hypothetical protein